MSVEEDAARHTWWRIRVPGLGACIVETEEEARELAAEDAAATIDTVEMTVAEVERLPEFEGF